MDLDAATRGLMAALAAGDAPRVLALLAPQAVFEAPGLLPPVARPKLDAMVERAMASGPPARLRVLDVVVRRNVGLASWAAEGLAGARGGLSGLLAVTWDRNGRATHLSVQLGAGDADADAARMP